MCTLEHPNISKSFELKEFFCSRRKKKKLNELL
jgi:hypothetical protein